MIRRCFEITGFKRLTTISLAFFAIHHGALAQNRPTAGSLDSSFITGTENYSARASGIIPVQDAFTVFALGLQDQPDNSTKVIVAGDRGALFRVDRHGNPDRNFTAYAGQPFGFGKPGERIIYALEVLKDGRILIAGDFGQPINADSKPTGPAVNIGLLNPNGTTEFGSTNPVTLSAFNANVGVGAEGGGIFAMLRRKGPNHSILIGGRFKKFNGHNIARLLQLNPDGTLDTHFNAHLGLGPNGRVFAFAEVNDPKTGKPNGQVYVGGIFSSFNGDKAFSKLVRLNSDGSLDPTFTPVLQDPGSVFAILVQPNGKIIVGGDFNQVSGQDHFNIARLNTDGTLDSTFFTSALTSIPDNVPPTAVYTLHAQTDGKILVGGNFLSLNGATRKYIGRINPDGTLDPTFDPGDTLNNATQAIVLEPVQNAKRTKYLLSPVVGQTQAPRKVVHGDAGFFASPLFRLFGDQAIPLPATVTLTRKRRVAKVEGAEPSVPKPAKLRLHRKSGDPQVPLTVPFHYGHSTTATYGVDFTLTSNELQIDTAANTITFPAGIRTGKVVVNAIQSTPGTRVVRRVSIQLDPPAPDATYILATSHRGAAIKIIENQGLKP